MKVALVYSFKESDWFSCTIIVQNLRSAYEELYGKENLLHVNYSHRGEVDFEDLKKLAASDVEKIVFIDHKPTPYDFLYKLKRIEADKESNREYIVHVFGDFPLYLVQWKNFNKLMEGEKVKFVCASDKQKKYVGKYIQQDENIFVSPFPVDGARFKFDQSNRKEMREQLGVEDSSFLYFYVGRLSYMKRTVELIEAYGEGLRSGRIPRESKLVIAGTTDNLGLQYLGFTQIDGEYFRSIDIAIEKYKEFKDQIQLIGNIDNKKLNDYYNAADCFVSLSTYHDEDYGMSVAEALCAGLPAVLTNWAGYFSFQLQDQKQYCDLIDVNLGPHMPMIDLDMANASLAKVISNTKEFSREHIAESYHQEFTIEACAKKLGKIADTECEKYRGGTDFMVRAVNEQLIKGGEMFKLETNREFNNLYFKAYDVYAE